MRGSSAAIILAAPICVFTLVDCTHAQVITPSRIYSERCESCHGSDPAMFARRTLRRASDQTLTLRNGTPLKEFLAVHGRLNAREVETMRQFLKSEFVRGST